MLPKGGDWRDQRSKIYPRRAAIADSFPRDQEQLKWAPTRVRDADDTGVVFRCLFSGAPSRKQPVSLYRQSLDSALSFRCCSLLKAAYASLRVRSSPCNNSIGRRSSPRETGHVPCSALVLGVGRKSELGACAEEIRCQGATSSEGGTAWCTHPGSRAAVRNDLRRGIHVALVEACQGRAGKVQGCTVHERCVPLKAAGKHAMRTELSRDRHTPA